MKQSVIYLAIAGFFCFTSINASAQIKMNSKGLGALGKGLKAVTFSDSDAAKLASEAVAYMDTHNTIASETDPYTIRLKKLFAKHQNEGG
ncbi:MAG: peptidase, partial [Flavobacterium sp.]